MKAITKQIFVADDGQEFDEEQEALAYNETLYFKNPIHLTDEQIISLFRIIYRHWFENPDVENIKLSIAHDSFNGTGFAYTLRVKLFVENSTHDYSGIVCGYNDIKIFDDRENLNGGGFSVKDVYNYLQSINFFKRCESIPTSNPNITDDYFIIYDNSNPLTTVSKTV
ncbi:MAG: hypothetical protein IM613_18975 [Cytophagales bacterium]|nr:hypothetical protein [Cytophagales bacterium]